MKMEIITFLMLLYMKFFLVLRIDLILRGEEKVRCNSVCQSLLQAAK